MIVTPLYAGLLALMFLVLSVRAIAVRHTLRVGLGDGGDRRLQRRLRVHGNFAEYVPLMIVLMIIAELQGLPRWALHAVGVAAVAGRLLHAAGVGREPEPRGLREAGMALTFAALGTAAICVLAGVAGSPALGLR